MLLKLSLNQSPKENRFDARKVKQAYPNLPKIQRNDKPNRQIVQKTKEKIRIVCVCKKINKADVNVLKTSRKKKPNIQNLQTQNKKSSKSIMISPIQYHLLPLSS